MSKLLNQKLAKALNSGDVQPFNDEYIRKELNAKDDENGDRLVRVFWTQFLQAGIEHTEVKQIPAKNILGSSTTETTTMWLSPLQLAARNGHLQIAQYILSKASDPVKLVESTTYKAVNEETNGTGNKIAIYHTHHKQNALHLAAAHGHTQIVSLLLSQTYTPPVKQAGSEKKIEKPKKSWMDILTNPLDSLDDALAAQAPRLYSDYIDNDEDESLTIPKTTNVNLTTKDAENNTALHLAAINGDKETIGNLLKHGLDPSLEINTLNTNGKSAQDLFVEHNHGSDIRVAASKLFNTVSNNNNLTSANISNLSEKNNGTENKNSSLSSKNTNTVGTSTNSGNSSSSSSSSPTDDRLVRLQTAVKNDTRVEIKNILRETNTKGKLYGSNPDKNERNRLITTPNAQGETCLHLATAREDIPVLNELLDNTLDPKALINTNNGERSNCLHIASAQNDTKVLERLLKNSDATSINTKNAQGNTCLHIATTNGNFKAVQQLLKKSSDKTAFINIQNDTNKTCLHIAAAGSSILIL